VLGDKYALSSQYSHYIFLIAALASLIIIYRNIVLAMGKYYYLIFLDFIAALAFFVVIYLAGSTLTFNQVLLTFLFSMGCHLIATITFLYSQGFIKFLKEIMPVSIISLTTLFIYYQFNDVSPFIMLSTLILSLSCFYRFVLTKDEEKHLVKLYFSWKNKTPENNIQK